MYPLNSVIFFMKRFFSKLQKKFARRPSPVQPPAQAATPIPQSSKPPAPIKNSPTPNIIVNSKQYSETVKLTSQTNGPYAQKIKPEAIVMHDTCGNYAGSIDWTAKILDPKTGKRLYASYHCIIARDGRRTITNADDNRAYHAGESFFKGRRSLNGWSIGVAFERNSHTEPLQKEAIESALQYIIPRMKKWGITPEYITDHRTVSPNLKSDLKKEEFEKFHAELLKYFK
jgi:N-acetylmuramoyl-L-alanine amidase